MEDPEPDVFVKSDLYEQADGTFTWFALVLSTEPANMAVLKGAGATPDECYGQIKTAVAEWAGVKSTQETRYERELPRERGRPYRRTR